jgi:hypothetical protein
MVYMPQGARVVSNHETQNSMGGNQIHVHLPADAHVDAVSVERIVRTIETALPRTLVKLIDGNKINTFVSKVRAA